MYTNFFSNSCVNNMPYYNLSYNASGTVIYDDVLSSMFDPKINADNLTKCPQLYINRQTQPNPTPEIKSSQVPYMQTTQVPYMQTSQVPNMQTSQVPYMQTTQPIPSYIPEMSYMIFPPTTIQTQGMQPFLTQGMQPLQTQEMQPLQTQEMQPLQTQEMQPLQTQGMQPFLTQGMQPLFTQEMQPLQTQGMQPLFTQGMQPLFTQEPEENNEEPEENNEEPEEQEESEESAIQPMPTITPGMEPAQYEIIQQPIFIPKIITPTPTPLLTQYKVYPATLPPIV